MNMHCFRPYHGDTTRETRDDYKGEVAENIAMLALKLAGYHCLPSMQGKKYDFGVELNDGDFSGSKLRAPRQQKIDCILTSCAGFMDQSMVCSYSPNDFEIACCVSLQDRKALFSPGVEKSVSWTRAQFNREGMEVISFGSLKQLRR